MSMRRARVLAALSLVAAASPAAGGPTGVVPAPPAHHVPYGAYRTSSWPESVAIADFTGDGLKDVALSTSYYFDASNDFKLFLFAQGGDGKLALREKLDTHGTYSGNQRLTAADIDGDGDTDLLLGTSAGVDLFEQVLGELLPARLLTTAATGEVDVADIDGDHVPDLVVSANPGVVSMRGLGNGTFGPAVTVSMTYYVEKELGDVTGDGVLDLVGFTGGQVEVFAGNPAGTFKFVGAYGLNTGYWPSGDGLALGDFTGDGRTDVVVTVGGNSPGARLNVFAQQVTGTLAPAISVPSYDIPEPIEAVDVNRDGRLDVVVAHGGWDAAGIFYQLPGGGFATEQLLALPYASHYNPSGLAVGDVNGDGMPDLVVADYNHGLVVVRSTGQAQSWGLGFAGQLGNGATLNLANPVPPIAVPSVLAASAGAYHSLAVTPDGLWTWGLNNAGQLGDGTTTNRLSPVKVPGLSGVVAVAGGGVHSAAVRNDGTVWTWGWNAFGQLGLGTTATQLAPTQVPGLTGVVSVAAGLAHTLALKADGTVWAWGLNHVGQLGNGTATSSGTPVQVTGLPEVAVVAAGNFHSMALTRDGRVFTWGLNTNGQLGSGAIQVWNPVPTATASMPSAMAIAAGAYHSVALATDGSVWSWGLNTEGELGNGTAVSQIAPSQAGTMQFTGIAAGWYHTLAWDDVGQVYAWGWNHFGQLGTGTTTDSLVPLQVPGIEASAVAGGIAHSVAVTAHGT